MGEDLCPFDFGDDGTLLSLAELDGNVGVDRRNQAISKGACCHQIAEVPDVEDIEGAVDQDHGQRPLSPRGAFLGELVEGA